jgi:modulator of drug activity B
MKNVLIINAHQYYEGISGGKLNTYLIDLINQEMQSRGYEVQITSIEQGFDINEEVTKHLWADLIILQTPVYWFGSPRIYKKYVDEVFTAGMLAGVFITGDGRTRTDPTKQYGSGGLLQGKKYMVSLTWNAPQEAFDDASQHLFQGKSVDDVLVHNTTNYRFCGFEILPAFSCHDVMKAPQIENDIKRLRKHLASIF